MNPKATPLFCAAWVRMGGKAEPTMPRTFPRISNHKGMTLIEMMVVVTIIAGMAALATPYLRNRNPGNKKFLREFTVLSRELHTRAKLNGVIYRLVLDMGPDDPNYKEGHKYWVEVGNGKFVMSEKDEEDA